MIAAFLLVALNAAAQTTSGSVSRSEALALKAAAAREASRLEEAISLYRQALALRPEWAEGWWALGTIFYDREDYARAADALKKGVALDPRSGIAAAMLGLSEAKLGRNEDALHHLDHAQELGIGNNLQLARVMIYTKGMLFLQAGEFGKAQDTLDALARNGIEEEELLLGLGMAVLGIRPQDPAAFDPANAHLLRRAGHAESLAAVRDIRAAEREYDSLAATYPKFHNVQFAWGRFLLSTHQDDKAIEAFRLQIENTPDHLLARLGIAAIKRRTDPGSGLPYAEQAVKLAPKLAEAHYLLGALLLETGDTERAIRELETAQRQDPKEAKYYFDLGRAYTAANRKEDAARARAAFSRLNQHER